MKAPKGQRENPDNEDNSAGDPNLVGKQPTVGIRDARAGAMSACQEYDQNEPFYSKKVRSGSYRGQ